MKNRVDKYSSLQTSFDTGTAKGLTKGKRVILPSTFVGSPRYMDQLYFDGMAICSHVGFPNLFITLTCNPNWPEIRRLLSPLNLKSTDRPDIVSRIFRLKYEHMAVSILWFVIWIVWYDTIQVAVDMNCGVLHFWAWIACIGGESQFPDTTAGKAGHT